MVTGQQKNSHVFTGVRLRKCFGRGYQQHVSGHQKVGTNVHGCCRESRCVILCLFRRKVFIKTGCWSEQVMCGDKNERVVKTQNETGSSCERIVTRKKSGFKDNSG